MPNGDIHETRVVQTIPDEHMRSLFACFIAKRVLPVIIYVDHDEGHFYGIRFGERFSDWSDLTGCEMRLHLDDVHGAVRLHRLVSRAFRC